MISVNKEKWKHAMDLGIKSLNKTKVWTLVELPKDQMGI